jgi:predicted dehydrogenase
MGIRLGLLGCGSFGSTFIRHFKAHPDVERLALCDLEPERLARCAAEHGVTETYDSLEAIAASDLDAVALFTQNWIHGPQAVALLEAGKDVYSAVPAAASLEECEALVRAVEASGRLYMMGETSIFRAECVYCRERAMRGDFGQMVYIEAEYLHDYEHGLVDVYRHRWGARFTPDKMGDPPMHYPTHSFGYAIAIAGAHATSVSCLGAAIAGDPYHRRDNASGNPYGDEIALFALSNGASARMAEMRMIGHPGEERVCRVYGTEASFEFGSGGAWWLTKSGRERVEPPYDFGDLPPALAADRGGHGGSHAHLVHEFVSAVRDRRQPRMNVWEAVRATAPGLVAHQSAMRGGERLSVPDWGDPPG